MLGQPAAAVKFHHVIVILSGLHDHAGLLPFQRKRSVLILEEDALAAGQEGQFSGVFFPPLHVSGES